jgi:hypothetical protein
MYPAAKERVAAHLGLTDMDFYVELDVPRPPYVRNGDHVTVVGDRGHPVEGVVRGWLDGSVVVGALDVSLAGHGLVAPERVTFHADRSES